MVGCNRLMDGITEGTAEDHDVVVDCAEHSCRLLERGWGLGPCAWAMSEKLNIPEPLSVNSKDNVWTRGIIVSHL